MRSSQGYNEEKQTGRRVKVKVSANETLHSQRKTNRKEMEGTSRKDASLSPVGRVVTEDQYRARVSQKAYALYEKRQAATHLDDWFEAERLVKTELLAEGHWAGSV
jgi:hypothetical protein